METGNLMHEDLRRMVLFDLPGVFFRREKGLEQNFIILSDHWEELTGYSKEDTIQKISIFDLIFEDDKERVSRIINEKTINQDKWVVSYRILTSEGIYKWVEEKGVAVLNEHQQVTYLEGYINEIYPENESLYKDLSYQKAVNAASVVSITDLEGTILYVNDLFCHYSGYTKDELLGRNHRIVNSGLHPKSYFKEMWETITSGNIWRGEIRNISKDGRYYWVDTIITPIIGKEGEILQYLSIRNIISDKKHTEFIVKQIYEGLTIKSGDNFFKNMTEFCCNKLNIEYCYVGWYNETNTTVETISFKKEGVELEKAYFNLNGTPCQEVKNKRTISFPTQAQKNYPNATRMKELNIQSYLGIPIVDDKDKVLGLIVLMDSKPIKDLFDKEFILNFIVPRIGNEIHSWISENKLKELEFNTNNLLVSLNSQIAVLDQNGDILSCNDILIPPTISTEHPVLAFTILGKNYYDSLLMAIKETNNLSALKMYTGIEAISNNEIQNFQMEYSFQFDDSIKKYLLCVSRLANSITKLVIHAIAINHECN